MIKVTVQAIRDNSFKPSGRVFTPTEVSKGMVSLDDATGLRLVTDNESEVDIQNYYIGEELTPFQYEAIMQGKKGTPEYLSKKEYAETFGITRYGAIYENGHVKDVKPLSPSEHMVGNQQRLFDIFNKALDLVDRKVLTLKYQPKNKKDDKK